MYLQNLPPSWTTENVNGSKHLKHRTHQKEKKMPKAYQWLDKARVHLYLSLCYVVFVSQALTDINMLMGGPVAKPHNAGALLVPFLYQLDEGLTTCWTTAAR